MSSRDLSARDSAVGSGDDGRVSPWLDEVRSWISRQTEPATAHGTRPVERGNSTGIEKENTPEVKVGHKDMPKDSRGIETVSVADNFSPAYRSALVRSRDVDTVSVADNFNRKAGVGINISNALEAPNEGDWGVVLQSKYFQAIKEAEFSNVRLPVNWAAHSLKDYPYTVDPKFFARIDWAIKEARANGLEIILNMQNYDDLVNDPDGNDGKNSKRFVDIWKQIAEHYSDQPKDLAFELYNEPAINIDAKKWNLNITRKHS